MLASSVINVHVYTRAIKLTENVLKVFFVSSTFNWLRGSGEGIIYLFYTPSKDDFSFVCSLNISRSKSISTATYTHDINFIHTFYRQC